MIFIIPAYTYTLRTVLLGREIFTTTEIVATVHRSRIRRPTLDTFRMRRILVAEAERGDVRSFYYFRRIIYACMLTRNVDHFSVT